MIFDDFKVMVREMFIAADEDKDDVLNFNEFKKFSRFVLESCNLDGDFFGNASDDKEGQLNWN